MTTLPETGFERLLAALGADLLDAPDEEMLAVADELGQKPAMKGSIALAGVTFLATPMWPHERSTQQVKATTRGAAPGRRARRRPKGDTPSGS